MVAYTYNPNTQEVGGWQIPKQPGDCSSNETTPQRLMCLNAWSPVSTTIWERLGGMALLAQMCRCIIIKGGVLLEVMFDISKNHSSSRPPRLMHAVQDAALSCCPGTMHTCLPPYYHPQTLGYIERLCVRIYIFFLGPFKAALIRQL